MTYIIQAEEQEISLDLLQQLAAVLVAESPGLTHADATYRIHSSHGILATEEEVEANRISQRFWELGLRNFVQKELLALPKSEHLNLENPELTEEVELVAAARLHLVTERTVTDLKPLAMRLAYPRIPIPGSMIEERTVEESDTRYGLDLFTRAKHWQARPGSPLPIEALLDKVAMVGDAYLSAGVRNLMRRDRNLPTFGNEADYGKYLTWLYQLRYARR